VSGLLTAALIVRDEAAVLAACLRSLDGIVDETVVVDTGSVDDSMAIARAAGARVVEQAWADDFSAARNRALDEARGEWILYIDADERLAAADPTAVAALLHGAEEVAFRIPLRPFENWTQYREFRVWRNDDRIRFVNLIHEAVVPSIVAVGEADGRSIGDTDVLMLEHVGYEGDQTRKHLRNLPLLQRQLERTPDNLFMWHHLARVLAGLERTEEAERTLEHALDVARRLPYTDPDGALVYADLVAWRLAAGAPVGDMLAEGRGRYPRNWVLRSLEGRALLAEDRAAEALAVFEEIRAVDRTALLDDGPAYDERVFGERAEDQRAVALFRLGRYAEAAEAWAEAARLAPGDHTYGPKRQVALARARGAAST
jgi:glycosyltransferase involved in cell wall biosynthesis